MFLSQYPHLFVLKIYILKNRFIFKFPLLWMTAQKGEITFMETHQSVCGTKAGEKISSCWIGLVSQWEMKTWLSLWYTVLLYWLNMFWWTVAARVWDSDWIRPFSTEEEHTCIHMYVCDCSQSVTMQRTASSLHIPPFQSPNREGQSAAHDLEIQVD